MWKIEIEKRNDMCHEELAEINISTKSSYHYQVRQYYYRWILADRDFKL